MNISMRGLLSWRIVAILLVSVVIAGAAVYAQAQPRDQSAAVSETPGKTQEAGKPESEPQRSGTLRPLDFQRVQWAYHSLYITAIGVSGCILALFVCLYHGKDVQSRFEPFFGDGQVTQLVVIIAVAGNVCSLAIAGILGASEVSAIYGGIIGYVLGRGKKSGDSERPVPVALKSGQDGAVRES